MLEFLNNSDHTSKSDHARALVKYIVAPSVNIHVYNSVSIINIHMYVIMMHKYMYMYMYVMIPL